MPGNPGAASSTGPMPAGAGIGLRAPHYQALLDTLPALGLLEVHPENYFGDGGAPWHYLLAARRHYPLSLHDTGLNLGGTDPSDERHLLGLERVIARTEPALVSAHLCWSAHGGEHHHDLLPLPYTQEALAHVSARVQAVQQRLGRRLLIENLSSYLEYTHSTMPEAEFLAELCRRTGCALLLDVNNLYVSARNHGWDALDYLAHLPVGAVAQLHLAGHTRRVFDSTELLIDTHDGPVAAPVWALFRAAVARFGPQPTIIEWDARLPALNRLCAQAARAQLCLNASAVAHAAA